jgi:hypothetical protein
MAPDTNWPAGADDAPVSYRPADDERTPGVAIVEVEPGGEETLAGRSPEEAIDEVDQLLDAVEEALAALDDGSYGTCRTCGSAIEPERLADDPLARLCRSCADGVTSDQD